MKAQVREVKLEKVEELTAQCWVEYKEASPDWIRAQMAAEAEEKGEPLTHEDRVEKLLKIQIALANETNRLLSRVSAQLDGQAVARWNREYR